MIRVHTPKVIFGFVIGLFSSSSASRNHFILILVQSDRLTRAQESS
jgi:hypothetical protein